MICRKALGGLYFSNSTITDPGALHGDHVYKQERLIYTTVSAMEPSDI